GLGRQEDDPSVDRLLAALTSEEPLPPLEADAEVADWCLAPGVARGRTCGGNLALIAATVGTPYQLRTDGRIVLLEDVCEPPYRIDRMLAQLRLAGLFERCAAVGFGEMLDCAPPDTARYDLRGVVHEALAGLPLPVLWGLPFGHGARNQTVPIGVKATLDADRGRLTFHEAAATSHGMTDEA
ncbi:LD-carboxypeptidase, partial [bacterium]|nr:LD-carboxypeptidase [bacterium]